jgi:hypothetical protein
MRLARLWALAPCHWELGRSVAWAVPWAQAVKKKDPARAVRPVMAGEYR